MKSAMRFLDHHGQVAVNAMLPGSDHQSIRCLPAGNVPGGAGVADHQADIDWLRVVAILAVLVVHTAQVFSPWQHWAIQNEERSVALGVMTVIAWPWLMPLFMFIAGFGAQRSVGRKTATSYIRERTVRLVLPLIAGTLLLVPPQVYVERLHQGRFFGSYLDFYPHFFDGIYPEGNLKTGQLWFLAYLYAYVVLTAPVFYHIRRKGAPAWLKQIESFLRAPSVALFLPALPLVVGAIALRGSAPENLSFISDWANHWQLLICCLYGYAFASRESLRLMVDRTLPVSAVLAVSLLAWLGWVIHDSGGRLPMPGTLPHALFWTIFSFATVSTLSAVVGAAQRWLRFSNRFLAYAAPMVFAFYVVHQTVVVILAYHIVDWRASIALKFFVLLVTSFMLSVALVHAAKHWSTSRWLLGMRATVTSARLRRTGGDQVA